MPSVPRQSGWERKSMHLVITGGIAACNTETFIKKENCLNNEILAYDLFTVNVQLSTLCLWLPQTGLLNTKG